MNLEDVFAKYGIDAVHQGNEIRLTGTRSDRVLQCELNLNKDLIVSPIQQDLKHHQLVLGLDNIGLQKRKHSLR